MDNKAKDNKKNSSNSNKLLTGFYIGMAVVLAAEVGGFLICSQTTSDIYTKLSAGKGMELEDFEDALDEYETVQRVYNYYLSGNVSTYYIGDFDYPMLERAYYNAKSAGTKTYLKNCLDEKIIEYSIENPEAENIEIQDLYEDALWETFSKKPLLEHSSEKTIDDYLKECYGDGIINYADYRNLELNEEEEETVQFIKRGR